MPRLKRVAIIGAGPSGLVTAKTLLHSFPHGTFSPTIFEKSHRIGGLWPSEPSITGHGATTASRGLISPSMRTNLSRFSVAFSDLAWESVLGDADADAEVPVFPQAWQVGRYLEKYAERYIPDGVLRLGAEVVQTDRGVAVDGLRAGWTVRWVERSVDGDCGKDAVKSEQFDYLVVTSGYFAKPHFPDIPGLDRFGDNVVHSTELQSPEDVQRLIDRSGSSGPGGKLVVVGGSMSGVEAASTLALHLSSLNLSPGQSGRDYEVHHVCSRPFWTIPTYLPHSYSQGTSQAQTKDTPFLPLDLVLYDLGRRPPGPIEHGFGPPSTQQIGKINGYFSSLLGEDYTRTGSFGITNPNPKLTSTSTPTPTPTPQPPWVAIGDDYAEYVRAGSITVTIGRVSNIHTDPDPDTSKTNLPSLTITLPQTQTNPTSHPPKPSPTSPP
ncbi:FAD/NAD(P)-binding domain-containing protein [Aspergillus heteromorphus CBS 117.55]|uniref:FAD/NAD(P)-binding domain-containing protein n=1 Tax=Aspergillus heteromorphus CBS 117.55 TaxID=1448321 RepID=A0A317VWH3_9EURO|nr:FAD/NAD(P)-binding domain-containing protein [Aspergillus heteromorphus CBS 117.55]PWY77342.1 FAD/NAD(P)-binding domain-containing protein [Aspergillus heteromorphus CBS 117.55]